MMLGLPSYHLEWVKLVSSNLVDRLPIRNISLGMTNNPQMGMIGVI